MAQIKTVISIKVSPGASRNQVQGLVNGVWKMKIAAAPDKGKANKELIEFLARQLGLRKDAVEITRGLTAHNKLVTIAGLSQEDILRCLSSGVD
jgi:uncharacterized protein